MSIAQYIKVIGRGKDGARPLTREQAADLFGQVLDRTVTDLEVGGFCLAMRIKGETPEEMAGFLDATYQRMQRFPASDRPVVVLPSYNGARKLPVLTPLLALLLAGAATAYWVAWRSATKAYDRALFDTTLAVAEQLRKQHRIGLDQRQPFRHPGPDTAARVALAHPRQHCADNFFHGLPVAPKLLCRTAQAHQLQGVFGHRGQVGGLAGNAAQQAVLLGRAELVALRLQ